MVEKPSLDSSDQVLVIYGRIYLSWTSLYKSRMSTTFDRELVWNTFRCLLVMCISCAACMLASFKSSCQCHKLHVCLLDKSIMCKIQAICSSCLQLSSCEGKESCLAVESSGGPSKNYLWVQSYIWRESNWGLGVQ